MMDFRKLNSLGWGRRCDEIDKDLFQLYNLFIVRGSEAVFILFSLQVFFNHTRNRLSVVIFDG